MLFTKKEFLFIALFIAAGLTTTLSAQQLKTPAASPGQTLTQDFGLSQITIDYSRPGVKGRVIFGDLVPYGKIWRTGANGSTTITFGDDVSIDGHKVPAGKYSLYTIPGKDMWTVMLNKDLTLGGNVGEYDQSKEVLRIMVRPQMFPASVETFTISINNVKPSSAEILLLWDRTMVPIQVETDIDTKIMADIDKLISKDNRPYYQAASYYYDNNKDLNKAYEWVKKATEQNPNAYWIQALKTKIELKQNNKTAAAASAQKIIDMATKAGNNDYVKIGQDLLMKAK